MPACVGERRGGRQLGADAIAGGSECRQEITQNGQHRPHVDVTVVDGYHHCRAVRGFQDAQGVRRLAQWPTAGIEHRTERIVDRLARGNRVFLPRAGQRGDLAQAQGLRLIDLENRAQRPVPLDDRVPCRRQLRAVGGGTELKRQGHPRTVAIPGQHVAPLIERDRQVTALACGDGLVAQQATKG